jgi:hypothetical protein
LGHIWQTFELTEAFYLLYYVETCPFPCIF